MFNLPRQSIDTKALEGDEFLHIEEDPNGDWVKWKDVKPFMEELLRWRQDSSFEVRRQDN